LLSEHCGPCKRIKEALKEIKNEGIDGYDIEVLNAENDKEAEKMVELINKYNIEFVPAAIIEDQVCNIGVNKKKELFFNCNRE